MTNGQRSVWFNSEQEALWVELYEKKLTSKQFHNFVKDAFHDAVDEINIETITKKQVMEIHK